MENFFISPTHTPTLLVKKKHNATGKAIKRGNGRDGEKVNFPPYYYYYYSLAITIARARAQQRKYIYICIRKKLAQKDPAREIAIYITLPFFFFFFLPACAIVI